MGSACECGEAELLAIPGGFYSAAVSHPFLGALLCKSLHCGMLELEGLLALLSAASTWDLQSG